MKFVSGLPVALAAEHRAMVGELGGDNVSDSQSRGGTRREHCNTYLLDITSVK